MVKPWPTEAGLIFVAQMFRPCFNSPEVRVLESKNETGGEQCGGGREPLAVIQGLRSDASPWFSDPVCRAPLSQMWFSIELR